MNNDLISRSELIKALNEAQVEFDEYYKGLGKAKVITDNAPTVSLPDFKEGYKQAIIDGKTNYSRPESGWIREEDIIHLLESWADGYSYIEIPTETAIKEIKELGEGAK